jgi:hypothetical protein
MTNRLSKCDYSVAKTRSCKSDTGYAIDSTGVHVLAPSSCMTLMHENFVHTSQTRSSHHMHINEKLRTLTSTHRPQAVFILIHQETYHRYRSLFRGSEYMHVTISSSWTTAIENNTNHSALVYDLVDIFRKPDPRTSWKDLINSIPDLFKKYYCFVNKLKIKMHKVEKIQE